MKLNPEILEKGVCLMRVYENVRTYIKKNGLNQSSIVKKAGISVKNFDAILNGKQTRPGRFKGNLLCAER